jgi:two-component system chemotaxis sensor kinase CheA
VASPIKNQIEKADEQNVIHVDIDRLDDLLNLVGELVINRGTFIEAGREARSKFGFKEQVLELLETTEQVGRITDEIQAKVIKARMVPIGNVFERFKGIFSGLFEKTGKKITLEIKGKSTEIDKKVIDELAEPLIHLVRNALDHGIETTEERKRLGKPAQGVITLNAYRESNHLIIEVIDDGAGINIEAIKKTSLKQKIFSATELEKMEHDNLIEIVFNSNFSTASKVTELSGRGVGMDAARRKIELLGGMLTLHSRSGQGCTARIRLPLTMAIIQALLVEVSSELYAIPLEHVKETVRAQVKDIDTVDDHEVMELRKEALSLLRLSAELGTKKKNPPEKFYVVVAKDGGRQVGLVVDRVVARQEIVIKPLTRSLLGIPGISGASIAGNGNVFLILDVPVLCRMVKRGQGAMD